MSGSEQLCSVCGRVLPTTSEFFHRSRARRFGFVKQCKECVLAYHRDYYRRNAPRLRKQALVYKAEHRSESKRIFDAWRARGCVVCGEKDTRVIHAHHIAPKTKDNRMNTWLQPDVLTAELAKCIPLCANHHMIIHCELRGGSTTEDILTNLMEASRD